MESNGLTPLINNRQLIKGATSAIVGSWLAIALASPQTKTLVCWERGCYGTSLNDLVD